MSCEIFDPLTKCPDDILRTVQLISHNSGQLPNIICKFRLFDIDRFIRTECRQYPDIKAFIRRNLRMPAQVIHRIIRGADGFYIKLFHQLPCGIILEHLIAPIIDGIRIVRCQWLMNAKHTLQFQMAPMIHGISDQPGHDSGKGTEFFPVIGITGDNLLRCAIGTHITPFIMVTTQPDL